MRFDIPLVLVLLVLSVPASREAAAAATISDLEPIPLKSGVNAVARLAPDGRDGLVVLGWRDNGNAHGYDLALVLLQDRVGSPWNIVRLEAESAGQGGPTDTITDDPHLGEDMVRAFRFARGRLNGRPATLLLIATRDQEGSIPDPSRVTYEVYSLEHHEDVGTTPDHFALVSRDRSAGPFCNAETALSRRFDLPIRKSSAGPRTENGCLP